MNCKICGKELKHIGCHLQFIHKITSKEYLKQFPDTQLVNEESRQKYIDAKNKPEVTERKK